MMRREIQLVSRLWLAAACLVTLAGTQTVAQPLVTSDLTIYYDFDNFTDTVLDSMGRCKMERAMCWMERLVTATW
jgi:hypothetical protein